MVNKVSLRLNSDGSSAIVGMVSLADDKFVAEGEQGYTVKEVHDEIDEEGMEYICSGTKFHLNEINDIKLRDLCASVGKAMEELRDYLNA